MPRGSLVRQDVLNAIAEFDASGREAFLERYGFNGARDYFLIHEGRRYDSKAIAAVANKWAAGGGGQALTALELSGGRTDAAKRLRELGFEVTEPTGAATSSSGGHLDRAWSRFLKNVAAVQKGAPFSNFDEGVAAAWEGYKPRLRTRALEILAPESWTPEMIGTGQILQRAIDAVEIQEDRINLTNNLVFWQNRYGHANREHRGLLEAMGRPGSRRDVEQALFGLYNGDDEARLFSELSDLLGPRYPLLAYFYFLKDMDRFMPIQPTGFDQAFRELGIDLVTLRNCRWDNYLRFNAAIGLVRDDLTSIRGISGVRLVDAHSYCWLLVKLPEAGSTGSAVDPGRVLGARAKAIVNMRLSIERTVAQANGQTVLRVVKNKDLLLDSRALEKLLEQRLEMQENRCALTGIPFDFAGTDPSLLPSPDRIDSSGHYAEGNIQVVCRFVNFWKSATENDEFLRLLDLIRHVE
ncbi:hypothetical protein [Sphingobium nicotianae]|uniref:hypothetical protein n=1 Tax=Sphingobium nicotianae TaxID=2782607 RepID=UPI001BE48C69|nr:hypothetical protein [Sphingobium nicotianae]